jgi:hypothetical protein
MTSAQEVCPVMLIGAVLLFDYIRASVMRMVRISLAFSVAVFTFFQKFT